MSEQGSSSAMGAETPAGAMPATTPGEGATPPTQPPADPSEREAHDTGEHEDPREAGLGDEGRRLLREARKSARDAERELKALRDEKQQREDAEKTDIQRLTER